MDHHKAPASRHLPATLLASLVFVAGCATVGEIDSMGGSEFQKIRAQTPVSDDAGLRAYVGCVADAIIAELPEPYAYRNWELEIFDSEEVNAFALPGGHIGIYTGLLAVAGNQDQLAAVIGHEIAHVTEQHALKRYNREAATRIGVTGVAIATGTGQAGADLLGMATSLGLSLPFSRGEESEADTVGLHYMAAAGFDPRQSVALWQSMEKNSKLRPPELLSTHPSSEHRISDLIAELPEALATSNAARAAGKDPQCRR
ncbi:MAG: M48 family metallopeptidase [Gammaproteobacteria bacterium]|nr:M48 family metallopeptidase [Gammaproteobacteria bacterium]